MITKKINGGNFEPVVTGEIVLDAVPTEGSLNSVTSDGVAKAIAEGGGGGSYTAGDGIAISEGEISAKVDGTTIQVNADGELEAIGGGGGGSYTAGDGITIDNDEISAVLSNSSGGMQFDDDGIAIDWNYMENSSDGTLVAISDGGSNTSGIKVANPLPAPSSGDSGKVLKVGSNGPEWGWQRNAEEPLYINNQGNVAIQLANTLYDNYGFLDIRNPVPSPTGASSGDVLTIGQNGPEWAAPGGGGTSYSAGNGISIDGDEISAVLGMSSGGMAFDNDGIAIDWSYVENSSDGTLEAVSDGYGGTSGIKVVNPVPDTTGASTGDVLTIGQSGPEWAAPAGGASYTAGDGIAISDHTVSALVNTNTLSLLAQEIRSSGMGGNIISLTEMHGLSASTTVSTFEYRFTPSPYGSNPYYKLTYDSSTQEGLRVRLQVGSDSSFTKYATSKEDFRVRDSSYNTSFLVLGTNSQGTDTLTLLNMGSLSLANMFDFVGGDSFDDIFSGSSVYVRFVAWDSTNSVVVGSPLNMQTANGSGYFYLVTSANAKKITVNLPVPRLSGTSGGEVLTVGAGGSGIEWETPSGVPTQLLTPAQTASMIETGGLPSMVVWYNPSQPITTFTRGGGLRRLFVGIYLDSTDFTSTIDFNLILTMYLAHTGASYKRAIYVPLEATHLSVSGGQYVYIAKEFPLYIPETYYAGPDDGDVSVDSVEIQDIELNFDTSSGGSAPTTLTASSLSVWVI